MAEPVPEGDAFAVVWRRVSRPASAQPEAEVSRTIALRLAEDRAAAARSALLERLRKLQTKEASAFLQGVRSRYPANGSARIKLALEDAVNNRPVIDRPKKP